MRIRTAVLSVLGLGVLIEAYALKPAYERWVMEEAFRDREPAATVHGPTTMRDVVSGLVFYVESDRRHITALDRTGVVLWCRDPFTEVIREPYRIDYPVISWIGIARGRSVENRSGRYLAVSFDSTQFGIIDIRTGHFRFLGQD